MKFKSATITEASGSVGGATWSHNRGGQYIRARAIPVNPATSFQQIVRAFMAGLTSEWGGVLTPAERDSWDQYALNVLMPDALGEPRNVGGLGMFVRSNLPRLQAGMTQINTAPAIFNLGDFTLPTIASITTPTALSLGFTDTDAWVDEDDSAMLIYGSRGKNVSVNFFKGPYRFADLIAGDAITPPTTPVAIVMPFTLAVGQRAFVQGRITRADGRLSSPFRLDDIVV